MPSEAAEVAGFRAELARLERHPALMSSPRQKQLLRYLFEECLAGRCDHISQYTIAFGCFGLGHEFDAAANTVVRSHALRLRKTLKKLARPDGCHRILMAERGYGLRFGCAMEAEARTTPPFQRARVGVMELELNAGLGIDASFPARLAAAMVAALAAKHDLLAPVGPLPCGWVADPSETRSSFSPSPLADYLLGGEIVALGGKTSILLRIFETAGGHCLWSKTIECTTTALSPPRLQGFAEKIISRITGCAAEPQRKTLR